MPIILRSLEKLKRIIKLQNLKLLIELELQNIKIFLVKVTTKIGQDKYLLSILFLKLILGLVNLEI